MKQAVLNAPPKIYLCLGDEDVSDVDFKELTEVSWSDDQATVHTVEYIRADRVEKMIQIAKLQAHIDILYRPDAYETSRAIIEQLQKELQ